MSKFVVTCERIGRKQLYCIRFQPNNQLIGRIKDLEGKWSGILLGWEISTISLIKLIRSYRKSSKIHFEFGDIKAKQIFVKNAKKAEEKERVELETLEKLKISKELWNKWKLELEENFEKYVPQTHKNLKDFVKLYPHQIIAIMFIDLVNNVLLAHEMGLGKANPLDSKLLTPSGWVLMKDICVGDYVIGSDGKPKEVLGVFPQGFKDIYEVKFNDGTTAQSCDEHLWNVNTQTRNHRGNPYQTKSLREIIDGGLTYENGNNKNYIPIVNPIEFNEKDLKIDPYVLGCLLGDGSITTKNSIGFTSIDSGIINELESRLPDNHQLVLKGESLIDYYLTADGKNNFINQNLKHYSLKGCNSHTKFIPEDYLYSSIEQRVDLLCGILDTDGHSRLDGIVELTLASKELILGVQFIVQSLGGVGRLHEKWVVYNGEDRLYWRLNIKLPPQFVPFKLERKIKTYKPPTKYLPNRAIVDVEYVGEKEAQCILIDSEDHLYCTDNCILTHNTLASIGYVEMKGLNKVVVVTPNSLKFNFFYEVLKFTGSKAHVINWGKKKNEHTIEESKYIIVNYEYFNPKDSKKFRAKWDKLNVGKIDCVICDESHRLKNTKSNTYKNFNSLFTEKIFNDGKIRKIFMSGTPAPNRAHELFSVLNQISPLDFKTATYFKTYYCGMEYDFENGWGWGESTADTRFEELFYKISPYTHRKKKVDVLTDLPDKTYQKIMFEMTPKEQEIYEDIEEGIANQFINEEIDNPLTKILRLRQYTSHLKIKQVGELIENVLDSGEKIVVVDVFKESLLELKEKYGNIAGLHTGDQTVEERAEIVRKFQDPNDSLSVFLGSIQTCNYGLTLTVASKMVILSLPYSVGEYDQVADRLHRIGQENAVNIYPVIFANSVDEYIYSAIEAKRMEIEKVIDNVDYESNVGESVLSEVIRKLNNKHG